MGHDTDDIASNSTTKFSHLPVAPTLAGSKVGKTKSNSMIG